METLFSLRIPGTGGTPVEIRPPTGIPSGEDFSIGSLASGFIEIMMIIGIFLSLFYFIYGGFYWIQSRGNKEKLDKARRILTFSILGLIIMSTALVIVNVIMASIGIETIFDP